MGIASVWVNVNELTLKGKSMSPFQRVLVPFDFTRFSEAALGQAVRIAEANPTELVILHVLATKENGDSDSRRAAALHGLEQAISSEKILNLSIEFVVREGLPAEEIAAAARERNADLVVRAHTVARVSHTSPWGVWPNAYCGRHLAPY